MVNLAGVSIGDGRWNEARKTELVESRTKGTALMAETLAGLDTKPLVGHLAAWNYFQSIDTPLNKEYIDKWHAFTKNPKRVSNDPMEAHVIGFAMWVKAVEKAKSFDVAKVTAAMAGQTFTAPSGITSKMDEKNHHLWKPVFIGEIQPNGQFNVVWKTKGPVRAQPWSQFIAGNETKKDEPEKK